MPHPKSLNTDKELIAEAAARPGFITHQSPAFLAATTMFPFRAADFWPIKVTGASWSVSGPGPTTSAIVIQGYLNGVAHPGTTITIAPGTPSDTGADADASTFETFEFAPGDVWRWDVSGDVANAGVFVGLALTYRGGPVLR